MLARRRWLRLAADWTCSEMESSQGIGRIGATQKINQHIPDRKMGGKIVDSRSPEEGGGVGIWVSAGARNWDDKTNLVASGQTILPNGPVLADTLNAAQRRKRR